jgi:hypothetical protein
VVSGVQVRSGTFVWPDTYRVRHYHVAHRLLSRDQRERFSHRAMLT